MEIKKSKWVRWENGLTLKDLRSERKLSIQDLARLTVQVDPDKKGISRFTIYKIEKNLDLSIQTRTLVLLRMALNIDGWLV